MEKYWTLGRAMMIASATFKDDIKCNNWARVGDLLTTIGSPFGPKSIKELNKKDRNTIYQAYKELMVND